ncbi:hypothetical protein OG804_18170 [Nocardia sp. NBC_00416]
MGMQKMVCVTQYLDIDTPILRISRRAHRFDRSSDEIDISEKSDTFTPREIREPIHTVCLGQRECVAGQELHIADYRECRTELGDNSRIPAVDRRENPIVPPVTHSDKQTTTGPA